MLISSRIVLLHSPSGAGKTSLIQASIIPSFEARRFRICVQREPYISALRINEPPPGFPVRNRYVYSVVSGLVSHLAARPADLATTSLVEALAMLDDGPESGNHQLLVFDQLEEALTLDPTDHEGQREFFRQVGEALDDDRRWGLLSMREDYMGGLDRFLKQIPGRLRATYRLDFLTQQSALRAIREPASERGVEVADDAAQKLVDDLRTVMVEGRDKIPEPRLGPYVEPVLLQVVCDRLWRKSCEDSAGELHTISVADLERLGQVNDALRRYYADAIREAAGGNRVTEHMLRDWVADELVTKDGFRRQQRTGPRVQDPDGALKTLQDRYLIRSEERAGARWWELSHDRLIEPLLDDNAPWRVKYLEPWQVAAANWHGNHEDDSYLLRGEALRQARRSQARNTATYIERRFIERSQVRQAEESTLKKIVLRVNMLAAALGVSIVLNALLVIWLVRR